MSEFVLRFDTNNAAFDDHSGLGDSSLRDEIASILREVAQRIEGGDSMDTYRNIMDSNGNIVGTFKHKKDFP